MSGIEVVDLCKSFGRRMVLNNVCLTVDDGSMVAISGPSGSGKSTLLNCIGLLDSFSSGDVRVGGESLAGIGRRDRMRYYRYEFGYLFQNYALLEDETVERNLDIACAYVRARKDSRRTRKLNALDRVGLQHKLSARVYELSGGEQQRIALARILVRRPKVILADEPTGALDGNNRDGVMELLQGLRDEGATIIIVTHDPEVVARCDAHVLL